MLVIRTAKELARALDSPLEPELKLLLAAHRQRLAECEGYDLSELAEFAIARPEDTIESVSRLIGIVGEGVAPTFSLEPEFVEQHAGWIELVFIYSDFGEGLVLFISTAPDTDPLLLDLVKRHLDEFAAD